ncbi:hypothetical protein C8R45DRAFT_929770 [Mycena sanguinolenta]|nr:hypothetical protein C8R45DRAFT_929770 [Mycena sanguinolenta]
MKSGSKFQRDSQGSFCHSLCTRGNRAVIAGPGAGWLVRPLGRIFFSGNHLVWGWKRLLGDHLVPRNVLLYGPNARGVRWLQWAVTEAEVEAEAEAEAEAETETELIVGALRRRVGVAVGWSICRASPHAWCTARWNETKTESGARDERGHARDSGAQEGAGRAINHRVLLGSESTGCTDALWRFDKYTAHFRLGGSSQEGISRRTVVVGKNGCIWRTNKQSQHSDDAELFRRKVHRVHQVHQHITSKTGFYLQLDRGNFLIWTSRGWLVQRRGLIFEKWVRFHFSQNCTPLALRSRNLEFWDSLHIFRPLHLSDVQGVSTGKCRDTG